MRRVEESTLDLTGIGIGPFNLSTAALAEPIASLQTRFFDHRSEFYWHPGLLFPNSTIQVSFLRDLVTLVDPTNPYSFLAFLAEKKRLYRFLNSNFDRIARQEFNQYMRWACSKLSSLAFKSRVEELTFEEGAFTLHIEGGQQVRSRHVVLGTGRTPKSPQCAQPHLCEAVFHASEWFHRFVDYTGKRVAVIGGGQTGAEMVDYLIRNSVRLPNKVHWITRRTNFYPLDETPFTNEIFSPAYSDYFYGLSASVQARLIEEQKLASDGISTPLLERLYRRFYELEFLEDLGDVFALCPGHVLESMTATGPSSWELGIFDALSGSRSSLAADIVILCTGYESSLPSCLAPLSERIPLDGQNLKVREDYSIEWDGPVDAKIFVQNAAKHCRGVADPNLSLMARRSAKILNSVAGRTIYEVDDEKPALDRLGDRPLATEESRR
jgi:lysine N6-hydroxylase